MENAVIENKTVVDFYKQLLVEIQNNQLTLPTLPEIAVRVREVVEDPNSNTSDVAKIIGTDASLTTRILKVANSPLVRANQSIDNVMQAVTRMGNIMVRNLVTSLMVEQLYQAGSLGQVKQYLKEVWMHSTFVAALSHILAKNYTKLSADEAMLAGLIHDIGAIPIIMRAEIDPDIINNPATLRRVIFLLHRMVGERILTNWNFSKEITKVVIHHDDIKYDSKEAELVDVVLVANMMSYADTQHEHTGSNWDDVPSFKKLNLTAEQALEVLQNAKDEVRDVQRILTG